MSARNVRIDESSAVRCSWRHAYKHMFQSGQVGFIRMDGHGQTHAWQHYSDQTRRWARTHPAAVHEPRIACHCALPANKTQSLSSAVHNLDHCPTWSGVNTALQCHAWQPCHGVCTACPSPEGAHMLHTFWVEICLLHSRNPAICLLQFSQRPVKVSSRRG